MKKVMLLACAVVAVAGVTYADIVLPPTVVTISGSEASKIAEMMWSGNDEKGSYAEGDASISCVKKTGEKEYTCIVKVK